MTAPALVQKLWNYCNILRDDGLSYGDYVEQLTFLPFLKMADEQSRPPFNKPSPIPKGFDWSALVKVDGDDLETLYRHILEELGKRPGMLGIIFRNRRVCENLSGVGEPGGVRRGGGRRCTSALRRGPVVAPARAGPVTNDSAAGPAATGP